MSYQFEKFVYTGSRFVPRVSIRRNASIGFSQGAIFRYKLNEGKWAVVLYYDRSASVIGIKLTRDPQEEGAVPLVVRTMKSKSGKTSLNAFIAAKSFFDYYAIPYNKMLSLNAVWDEQSSMMLLQMPSTTV